MFLSERSWILRGGFDFLDNKYQHFQLLAKEKGMNTKHYSMPPKELYD